MAVTFTVTLQGTPLRRTYVSHFDFFRVPQTLFFRTNETGQVTVANAGLANVTGDPTGPSGTITVTVHAQNSVVRVLDGNFPIPVEVTQNFSVANGGTININTNAEQRDHFRIMDSCLRVYDAVFRQFSPFNRAGRQAFPFGQDTTVAATRNMLPRIEVVYPDNSPSVLAFVEPVSLGTGFPLIHLKHKTFNPPGPAPVDRRLFGVPDPVPDAAAPIPAGTPAADPTLIPHELAHALYFALMPRATRVSVEAQYLVWITNRIASGLPPFHNTNLATTPFIAWIESLGIFSERFFFFSLRRTPPLTGVALRQAFFRDELSAAPLLQTTNLTGYSQVGTLNGAGNVVPALTGDNVEGAIYGSIFLDFARRVGLREAVGRYLNSADNNVLAFDDFRNLVINETDFDTDIIQAANTWGL
ncbi:MAG: hypothetical protein IT391_11280 [Nitrospira sp.]|nr:hypothetical protein [Nitrospira sp.]